LKHETGNFAGGTAYKATVTLTAKSGFTFAGIVADMFTYTGATSVTHSAGTGTSLTVTISFPQAAAFVAVTDITGVPTTATMGTALTLTGTVAPSIATNKTIVWSLKAGNTAGATLTGASTLNTTQTGSVTVIATIANGTAQGTRCTQRYPSE
jgi:endo-1,4-beta-xylanase